MGLFDRFLKKKVDEIVAKRMSNMASPKELEEMMRMIAQKGGLAIYGQTGFEQYIDAYATNDDIYSIVNKVANTAAMVPLVVYKVKDEQALKKYKHYCKNMGYDGRSMVKHEYLKNKALEAVSDDNQWQQLLNRPNPINDATEFRTGVYLMRLLTGNTYVYYVTMGAGVNEGKATEMWLLPSQYTQPIITQTFPREVLGYQFRLNGIEILTTETVMHLRKFNPNYTWEGGEIIGLSPLQAAHKTKVRSEAETDYSVKAFQNSGANGLVYRKDVPVDNSSVTSMAAIKKDYYAETAGRENIRKNAFVPGEWGFVQIGISPVDMALIESEKYTKTKLCNVYNVSPVVMGDQSASTESNVKEMVKQLWTNAALPEAYAYRDALNLNMGDMFPGFYVDADITGIPELQEDMKDFTSALAAMPFFKPNHVLKQLNIDPDESDPNMDKWYIKTGYRAIDEMENINDIENTGDYGKPTKEGN